MKKEGHLESYKQFKGSYLDNIKKGESRIKPIAQDAMLLCFHLIEAVVSTEGMHINKHQQTASS